MQYTFSLWSGSALYRQNDSISVLREVPGNPCEIPVSEDKQSLQSPFLSAAHESAWSNTSWSLNKGNDNAILYQILTCADCLDAATDSVGRAYSSGKNFADMPADLRCNAGRMFNPDLVQLFDREQLQQQIESLITVDREQLYREVFGKNVSLVL